MIDNYYFNDMLNKLTDIADSINGVTQEIDDLRSDIRDLNYSLDLLTDTVKGEGK